MKDLDFRIGDPVVQKDMMILRDAITALENVSLYDFYVTNARKVLHTVDYNLPVTPPGVPLPSKQTWYNVPGMEMSFDSTQYGWWWLYFRLSVYHYSANAGWLWTKCCLSKVNNDMDDQELSDGNWFQSNPLLGIIETNNNFHGFKAVEITTDTTFYVNMWAHNNGTNIDALRARSFNQNYGVLGALKIKAA